MKIYVINLPKDNDRKAYMQKILKEQNLSEVSFIDAFYGKNISLQEKEHFFDIKRFINKYAKIPNDAQIGCALSHRKCYEEFLKTQEPYSLVLEDDIVPKSSMLPAIQESQHFLESINKPAIVLLSGWFWYTKKICFHSTALGKLYSGFLAHSYMINEKAAKLLLEKKIYYVADDWYEFRKNLGIEIYGIIPHIVNQKWDGNFKSSTESLSIKYEKGFLRAKCILRFKGIVQKILSLCGHFEGTD